jgi:hypothetical protein
MPIPFDTRLVAPADVLMRELDGEAVLLDLRSETYFGLDDVGTRIWNHVTTAPSVQAAYEAVLAEYDVAPDVLRHDLEALLDELVDRGLLARVDG